MANKRSGATASRARFNRPRLVKLCKNHKDMSAATLAGFLGAQGVVFSEASCRHLLTEARVLPSHDVLEALGRVFGVSPKDFYE